MLPTQSSPADTLQQKSTIKGITEPTILRYFEALNARDFAQTAALFAAEGVMHPPFESGIVGPEAIAYYLQQEAQDLKAEPHEGVVETLHQEQIQIQIIGKAQTSWCSINVLWLFILNEKRQILYTKIKLIASPQELLSLRRG